MDLGGAEGELEGPDGGEVGHGDPALTGQFDADQRGAPIGVESLDVAGTGDDRVGVGATAAAPIARLQAVESPLSEGPPDLPDRVVGDAEFAGDTGVFVSVEAAADDLLSDRHR